MTCLLLNGPGPALSADPAPVLTLPQAVALAVAGNPGLAGMQARAEAMAAIPSQAGSLPDPMLSLNAMNLPTDTFDLGQEPMTQLQVGIEQALPFPGKRGLKQQAAAFDAGAAASNTEETRLHLIRSVRENWWQLYYLDRALAIVARNRELLRQFVEIARTRYKVGEGLQQEVLLAQVELSRLFDRRIELEGLRKQQAARLNALLDRHAAAPVILPEQVDEELPAVLPEAVLYTRAESARPLLLQRRQEVEAARTRHDLAQRERYPDFKLGAAYGFRHGDNPNGSARPDFASVMLGMSLPLYAGRKQDMAVSQRSGELRQQQYTLQDELLKVQADISAALADYRRASEQVELFRTGIIPQARQSVASMLSGYQVNKVDFLNLVRAQITLYDFETRYWKSFTEARQALAHLIAAVGGEVTE
ncbi:MAG: TolC family protein [Gammaproteobacteria bacterium]|jgi:outer membrane protein TolC